MWGIDDLIKKEGWCPGPDLNTRISKGLQAFWTNPWTKLSVLAKQL